MKRFGTVFLMLFTFAVVSARGQARHMVMHSPAQLNVTPATATMHPVPSPISSASVEQPLATTQIDSVSYYGDTSGTNWWVYVPVLNQSTGDSLGYYGVSQSGNFYYQNADSIGPLEFSFYHQNSSVLTDTTVQDTMYDRMMALRVSTPTDIKSPRLTGMDLAIYPVAMNPADHIQVWVVPMKDEEFGAQGSGSYYPIPDIFGPQLASGTVLGSTLTVGQMNNIHLNFNKPLYSGSRILYPHFGICIFVAGPDFMSDTVGYVMDQNLQPSLTSQNFAIDTDGSLGVTGEPMRTYKLTLDAGNIQIDGSPSFIGGGGGFFVNFGQLDPTSGQQTGSSYNGNLVLTTYFSGTSLAVTPGDANNYSLTGNSPNPVGASTQISYTLGQSGPVSLTIYNALGERVGTVASGTQSVGEHSATFVPGSLPNGMYYYKLQSGDFSATRTMVISR